MIWWVDNNTNNKRKVINSNKLICYKLSYKGLEIKTKHYAEIKILIFSAHIITNDNIELYMESMLIVKVFAVNALNYAF